MEESKFIKKYKTVIQNALEGKTSIEKEKAYIKINMIISLSKQSERKTFANLLKTLRRMSKTTSMESINVI